jgi:PmbA protein
MNSKPENDLLDVAERIVSLARALGADEISASVGAGTSTELSRRDGKVEKAQESRSMSASVDLMVDGRYSSHSTNDLRPDSFRPFLERAIAATRFLEPDLHRALPPRESMGLADAELDLDDPGHAALGPEARRTWAEELEAATVAAATGTVRSITAYVWDGASEGVTVTSNGFVERSRRTSFGHGATISLEDADGRLPEGYAAVSASHRADLPSIREVAADVSARAAGRLGSRATESGRYPMLLDRRAVGRVLGAMLGPLGATAIYEGRSCMADKLGAQIASSALTLWDEPLIVRGAGSRLSDGDGLPSLRRAIVVDGVLQMFFIDVYNARRMGVPVTTGGASNLVVAPGGASPRALVADAPRAIRVDGFLGGNTNATTGDFSFGIHGALLERGEVVQNLSEMNVAGNIFELLSHYVAAADDPWTFSAWRCPSLLFDAVQFSGT